MRILIVTMLGFNKHVKIFWEDQTAYLLSGLGHEVTAYAYKDESNPLYSKGLEERDGVKLRRFQPPEKIISLELRRTLRKDGPFDIIHLYHLRNKFSYEITQYSLRENIPLIFEPVGILHDPYLVRDRDFPFSGQILEGNLILTKKQLIKKIFTQGHLLKYFKNYSQHFSLKKARVLVALSKHEKDLLARITDRNDIDIVPLWIDKAIIDRVAKDFFELEFKRPAILFLGQLKYRRGFDIALKTFARVKREYPQATLIVVTNNPDKKEELLNLARAEGVLESLIIKENVSEDEKFSLYKQVDIYLSPTRYEGFGVTFLEAMACECPIVASNIPVVKEIVEDEKTGLLARLEDPYDFCKKIKRILSDHNLKENIIKQGLEKVEREYNKENIVGKLLDIYVKNNESQHYYPGI